MLCFVFFKLLLKQFWCWIKQPVMETERRGWWFKVVPSQSKGTWLSSTQQGSRFNATPCWIIMVSVSRADSPSRCYWASRKACMYLNVFSQEALWPSAPAAVLLSSADHCLQTFRLLYLAFEAHWSPCQLKIVRSNCLPPTSAWENFCLYDL